MTVRELIDLLAELPNQEAIVVDANCELVTDIESTTYNELMLY